MQISMHSPSLDDKIARELELPAKKLTELRVFHWEANFPEIFEEGGFDIVIGNPPYVRSERIDKKLKKILKKLYSCYHGRADLYVYFFERGLDLLKKDGILAYVTSDKYTRADYGRRLRKWILENFRIRKYIDMKALQVFKGVTINPSAIIIEKRKEENNEIEVIRLLQDIPENAG